MPAVKSRRYDGRLHGEDTGARVGITTLHNAQATMTLQATAAARQLQDMQTVLGQQLATELAPVKSQLSTVQALESKLTALEGSVLSAGMLGRVHAC